MMPSAFSVAVDLELVPRPRESRKERRKPDRVGTRDQPCTRMYWRIAELPQVTLTGGEEIVGLDVPELIRALYDANHPLGVCHSLCVLAV